MIKSVRTHSLVLFTTLSLIAPAVSPGIALAASVDPSPCIWDQIPAADRTRAMAQDRIGGVGAALGETLNSWSPEIFASVMTTCKVRREQQDAAAALLASHVVRIWAEERLADNWTVAELNGAYSGLNPAERALLRAGTGEDGTEPPGYDEAVKAFFGPLAIEGVPPPAIKLAFIYLITRLKQEDSLAAFSRL